MKRTKLETIFDQLCVRSGRKREWKGGEREDDEARATGKEEEGETEWFVNDGNETSSVFLGFVAAFSLQLSSNSLASCVCVCGICVPAECDLTLAGRVYAFYVYRLRPVSHGGTPHTRLV